MHDACHMLSPVDPPRAGSSSFPRVLLSLDRNSRRTNWFAPVTRHLVPIVPSRSTFLIASPDHTFCSLPGLYLRCVIYNRVCSAASLKAAMTKLMRYDNQKPVTHTHHRVHHGNNPCVHLRLSHAGSALSRLFSCGSRLLPCAKVAFNTI